MAKQSKKEKEVNNEHGPEHIKKIINRTFFGNTNEEQFNPTEIEISTEMLFLKSKESLPDDCPIKHNDLLPIQAIPYIIKILNNRKKNNELEKHESEKIRKIICQNCHLQCHHKAEN